jgi:hypothetical protein
LAGQSNAARLNESLINGDVLKIAVNGSSLCDEWNPGNGYLHHHLMNAMSSDIQYVIWFQGEADSNNKSCAENYERNLNGLISSVDAQVIVAIISTDRPYNDIVRDAQLRSDAIHIETEDLTRPDGVHLDSAGRSEFIRRVNEVL